MMATSVVSRMRSGFRAARTDTAARPTPSKTMIQAACSFIVATKRTRIAEARPRIAIATRAALPIGCAAQSESVVMLVTVMSPITSARPAVFFRACRAGDSIAKRGQGGVVPTHPVDTCPGRGGGGAEEETIPDLVGRGGSELEHLLQPEPAPGDIPTDVIGV